MAKSSTHEVGYTDSIFQSFKVYIEGVQVPFENFSISQGVGTFPSCVLTIPPHPGLMDIARFYQPKVHIFYEDQVDKKRGIPEKEYFKLLFHGNITGVSYDKSRSEGGGNISIQFMCKHRNAQLLNLYVDYSSWQEDVLNPHADASLREYNPNSQDAVQSALTGVTIADDPARYITETNFKEGSHPAYLPPLLRGYFSRLQGMPGVMVNYWNQLRRAAYQGGVDKIQDLFKYLYEPLVNNGLHFFERISGHAALESIMEGKRLPPCPVRTSKNADQGDILIPPMAQLSIQSAAQTAMAINVVQNYMQPEGNMYNIYSLFSNVYESMDYELITLTSPSETPLTDEDILIRKLSKLGNATEITSSVETIIKPKIPFYFSPSCNIIYPQMFSQVSIQYDEENIPTRVILLNLENPAGGQPSQTRIRAPESIREAVLSKLPAKQQNSLRSSMGYSYGAIGRYEQARGAKPIISSMPTWLSYLSYSLTNKDSNINSKPAQIDPAKQLDLSALEAGWNLRYPNKASLNPWSSSDIDPAHKLLFAAADYSFTEHFASTKAGSVSGPFNPYIVPGYPMDILESSPQAPSFHALCTHITHSISSQGVNTTIGFTGAMTYSELVNYYVPFMYPALQIYLGVAENPTLVGDFSEASKTSTADTNARLVADNFYYYTLGTKALPPEKVYNFETGKLLPIDIDAKGNFVGTSSGSKKDFYGVGELNKNLTFQGNLNLAYRPIESQSKIENRFNYKFVDLTFANYSPTVIKYSQKLLPQDQKLEIGANRYLDYPDFPPTKAK